MKSLTKLYFCSGSDRKQHPNQMPAKLRYGLNRQLRIESAQR